ncbi:MAG TPA: hypothetical protein EYP61_04075, partial [Candidatus Latescibacteria bacterium]|nr:hypothetical protein [Candidatus Latescibacterota bacterium]
MLLRWPTPSPAGPRGGRHGLGRGGGPMRYVVRFDERDALNARLVGNKAKNLAELARKGFPVPRFFCVTTHA